MFRQPSRKMTESVMIGCLVSAFIGMITCFGQPNPVAGILIWYAGIAFGVLLIYLAWSFRLFFRK